VKTLPPSWIKSRDKQLSFADTLFSKPCQEDIFTDLMLSALKDAKYLRYRVDHSTLPRIEKLRVYDNWTNILDMGSSLLYNVSRKSGKFKHKTQDDFLHEVFINKIDWAPAETITRSIILHHHDKASASITGILLANTAVLKKYKREVKIIAEHLKASNITIHRLE